MKCKLPRKMDSFATCVIPLIKNQQLILIAGGDSPEMYGDTTGSNDELCIFDPFTEKWISLGQVTVLFSFGVEVGGCIECARQP